MDSVGEWSRCRGKNSILHVPDSNWLYAVGRLKPGVNTEALQGQDVEQPAAVAFDAAATIRENGALDADSQTACGDCAGRCGDSEVLQQRTGKGLYLLMTISGLVLLVACANVANLLLARGATRRAEISVRMALGAARGRLIRQMLTESILLGCMGGLAGLAVAYAGTRMILSLAFPDSPQSADCGEPFAAGAGVCVFAVAVDGSGVWDCAGVDHVAL